MIVNTGYAAIVKAASGLSDYTINGMYAVFTNSTPVEPTVATDRTPAYYAALSAPFGYVRFNTLSAPEFSPDTGVVDSTATFFGVAGGASAGGAAIVDGTSQFIEVALVAMPDPLDASRDVIISAGAIMTGAVFTPLAKIANSQCAFKWSLQLG